MSQQDNTRFLRLALGLRMIDMGQFNELMDIWEKDPTKDTAQLLRDGRYISKDQYDKILKLHTAGGENREPEPTDPDQSVPQKYSPAGEEIYKDNFTLRGIIGRGGIGRVFIGFDRNIRREVAIKEMIRDKPGISSDRNLARFVREAKITGQLEHPGIIPVYELDTKPDGTIFYVMKYVRGKTLYQAIKECESDPPEAAFQKRIRLLDNLISVSEAMGYAHSRGVIHRDLKPSNIILGEFGETIILDWGLAKSISDADLTEPHAEEIAFAGDDANTDLTQYGDQLGTPSYMSPEQIDYRFGDVDARSDVYTLGVVFYMILTGQKPYPGKGKGVMKLIATDEEIPPPAACGSFIPPELSAICAKTLSKDKLQRFSNALELASELKAYRDGRLVSVYAYTKKELFRRFVSRNRLVISSVAAVITAILIGAGFTTDFAVDAHRARARADRALSDVTNLSESAMELAREAADRLEVYYKGHPVKSGQDLSVRIITALSFDPLKSDYQVWCMDEGGTILYDEDPKQIGRHLFTDSLYTKSPELLEFGKEMRERPWGVGHYLFTARGGLNDIYKIAAWDTFTPAKGVYWKIVVTYPYIAR